MSDTLKIFGQTFTDVAGIKAMNASDVEETYVVGGGGGTGISIGVQNTPIPNILNMFYALEQGAAKTGTFTLSQALPNTEMEIFDTELTTVNGLFVADESQATINTTGTPENTLFSICFNPISSGTADYAVTMVSSNMVYGQNRGGKFLTRCSWRLDSGKLYCTTDFGGNANYSPFYPGHTYRWVAW